MIDLLQKMGLGSLIPLGTICEGMHKQLEKSAGKKVNDFRLIYMKKPNKTYPYIMQWEIREPSEVNGVKGMLGTVHEHANADDLIKSIELFLGDSGITIKNIDVAVLSYSSIGMKNVNEVRDNEKINVARYLFKMEAAYTTDAGEKKHFEHYIK